MLTAMLLLSLAACDGNGVNYPGTTMTDYFPFDGGRDATYVNADTEGVPWHLVTHKVEPTEQFEGREIATFEYSKEDGTLLYSVKWSVESQQPIQIEGWADGTGEFTMFDPPLVVAEYQMHSDSSVTTETGGYSWTSTYYGPEDCPVLWGGLDWTDCAHIRIDDGDGDDNAGPKFAGDYMFVTRYGAAWMTTTGYQQWTLSDYDWDTGGA